MVVLKQFIMWLPNKQQSGITWHFQWKMGTLPLLSHSLSTFFFFPLLSCPPPHKKGGQFPQSQLPEPWGPSPSLSLALHQGDTTAGKGSASSTFVGTPLRDFPLEQMFDESLRHTFAHVNVING